MDLYGQKWMIYGGRAGGSWVKKGGMGWISMAETGSLCEDKPVWTA